MCNRIYWPQQCITSKGSYISFLWLNYHRSVCCDIVLLCLPSTISGNFSGDFLICSRTNHSVCCCVFFSFAHAASDPGEMSILLGTGVPKCICSWDLQLALWPRERRRPCLSLTLSWPGALSSLVQMPVLTCLHSGEHRVWPARGRREPTGPSAVSQDGNLEYLLLRKKLSWLLLKQ